MQIPPRGIKYLAGWGDAADFTSTTSAAASVSDIIKALKKYSKRDRDYIKEKWAKRYRFYASELLEEEDLMAALDDGYLKKLNKKLDLN
jgi:adenine-specific DNA methylase